MFSLATAVVHTCLTPQSATAELPPLFAGNTEINPSSGLGSNAGRPAAERKVPRAVIFGGGVPDEQVAAVVDAIRAPVQAAGKGEEVRVVRVTREDILATGASGPSPGVIAQVLRGKLEGMVVAGEL
jgi:hypothetical protein